MTMYNETSNNTSSAYEQQILTEEWVESPDQVVQTTAIIVKPEIRDR